MHLCNLRQAQFANYLWLWYTYTKNATDLWSCNVIKATTTAQIHSLKFILEDDASRGTMLCSCSNTDALSCGLAYYNWVSVKPSSTHLPSSTQQQELFCLLCLSEQQGKVKDTVKGTSFHFNGTHMDPCGCTKQAWIALHSFCIVLSKLQLQPCS